MMRRRDVLKGIGAGIGLTGASVATLIFGMAVPVIIALPSLKTGQPQGQS